MYLYQLMLSGLMALEPRTECMYSICGTPASVRVEGQCWVYWASISLEIWIQISSTVDSGHQAYYPRTIVLFKGDTTKKKGP